MLLLLEPTKKHTQIEVQIPANPSAPHVTKQLSLNNASAENVETDLNGDRRKRRRTVSPAAAPSRDEPTQSDSHTPRRSGREAGKGKTYKFAPDLVQDEETSAQASTKQRKSGTNPLDQSNTVQLEGSIGSMGDDVAANGTFSHPARNALSSSTTNSQIMDRPKKLLVFNPKTGTIGSPTVKQPTAVADKKSKSRKKTNLIVTLSYGGDQSRWEKIGERIDQISSQPPCPKVEVPSKSQRVETPKKKSAPKLLKSPPKAGKPLHPLFMDKAPAPEKLSLIHI